MLDSRYVTPETTLCGCRIPFRVHFNCRWKAIQVIDNGRKRSRVLRVNQSHSASGPLTALLNSRAYAVGRQPGEPPPEVELDLAHGVRKWIRTSYPGPAPNVSAALPPLIAIATFP